MPWLETVPMEQRERFIDDHRLGLYEMTELCARYAISRKTGYKWLARYDAGGHPALQPPRLVALAHAATSSRSCREAALPESHGQMNDRTRIPPRMAAPRSSSAGW